MKKACIRFLSIILSVLFLFSGFVAYGDEGETTTSPTTTKLTTEPVTEEEKTTAPSGITQEEAKKTLEEQRADLEEKLNNSEKLLSKYADDAKVCEEYINALDEKIGYINEELTLLDSEISASQAKVSKLKPQIKKLGKELKALQKEYNEAKDELDNLNERFETTYQAYCLRLRALYVSGKTSVIIALLTSRDITQFFNRYAMIKAIAKSDTQLLKEVNSEIDKIITQQNGLNEKKEKLKSKKDKLDAKQADYNKQLSTIEAKQSEIARKKIVLSDSRAESDALLAEYSSKTQMYTEFRNEDEKLIEAVNKEIDDLLNGLKDPSEITTANESLLTTTDGSSAGSTDGELYSNSNAVLNLTYPVPSSHSVSQWFGHYRNGRPHTGIDYPCPTGSKVVAAQKGIVITVKRLNYSYGYYVMIYHGTDAQGRKIVTLYAHNSSILVSLGQSVSKGQQIAKSGSTGNSTGPHCHFELIIDGVKVNPKNYLS